MSDSIVDSCCIINLYAVGDLFSLLPPLGLRLHVPEKVLEESLYVRRPDPTDTAKLVPQAVNLLPAVEAGLLHRCGLTSEEELSLFVQLATTLDDGEAACLAIAKVWPTHFIRRFFDDASQKRCRRATLLRSVAKHFTTSPCAL